MEENTNKNHKAKPGHKQTILRTDGTTSASSNPISRYAELHAHSNYSFQEGASEIWDLLLTAKNIGLKAMAITDHDNITGAMEFSQTAKELGIKPIIGVEITLSRGLSEPSGTKHLPPNQPHITLLAETAIGYKNICRLTTRAHVDAEERKYPNLDPIVLKKHSQGIICLSGCRQGEISRLVDNGDFESARHAASKYLNIFGKEYFFMELQQNLVMGDLQRNQNMAKLANDLGVGIVATNNVHYHIRDRHRLNDSLIAIKHNKSLEASHRERRPNDQFFLKSAEEMSALFKTLPEAITNTTKIADRCDFDITSNSIYDFPSYEFLPPGHTESSYLRKICEEAAVRRYGSLKTNVVTRLDQEFALLEKHQLIGFVLQYYDIIKIAREVQEDLGLVEPGLPIEEDPPGRGRGSSVALLTGYLTGLSHIDPLKFGLRLDRFLPETYDGEKLPPPDIDLDFPREIRTELILRVHERWGYERAVLTGMISTYRTRGAIRDLGKALGIAHDDLIRLSKHIDGQNPITDLTKEIAELPEFQDQIDAPVWHMLLELAQELNHFPKYLAQHPSGMILSAKPLSETVPLQRSAIDGRYICQWDKNTSSDVGFVKIDFLALGALSQLSETLKLIYKQTEQKIDISRINFEDSAVYSDIHNADTIGVFQIESAAQMQTVTRLRPRNLTEMAWEVGAVRPGVGVNDGVTLLIRRHMGKDPHWQFDHPLEKPALERTYGVPLYQDQLCELAMHVGGMSGVEGEQMRRAFTRKNNDRHIEHWRKKFIKGALKNSVPSKAAEKIFRKFHGLYQFPEAHAFAFGVTAYQMSWLKHYYPLEFFIGLFNNQPMGFYNVETLKEDAVRHKVKVLGPDVNLSGEKSHVESGALRMGLTHVRKISTATASSILKERSATSGKGPFISLADFISRTGIPLEIVNSLSAAGALDSFDDLIINTNEISHSDGNSNAKTVDRRLLRWESGLRHKRRGEKKDGSRQIALEMPIEQDMVTLPKENEWERMIGEYATIGMYPEGHLMAKIRSQLPAKVAKSNEVRNYANGEQISVAGLVIRRQRPSSKTIFLTLEDEFGHSPLLIWARDYKRLKPLIKQSLILARGSVSRREGTMNIIVQTIIPIPKSIPHFDSHDWS